jgi:hypothetical protein
MNDSKKNVRLPIMVTEAEEKAIDDWRFAHRVESRAEAMRQLIARGLRPDSPAGEAAPAPVRQGRKRPPIDVARVRPYPAKAIAEMAKGARCR